MKKCAKVKNPCKICFQTVTAKNGLQCLGACQKWAHYKCLDFTPGKISDIRAGLIKINCPCPDCDINPIKKEVLTHPPYTCAKQECPANKAPICQAPGCPKKCPPPPGCPDSNKSCPEDCPSESSQDKVEPCPPPPCPPPPCPPPKCCASPPPSPPSSPPKKKKENKQKNQQKCPPPPCPPTCPPPKCPPKPVCPPPVCPPKLANCPFESCCHEQREQAEKNKCGPKCKMPVMPMPIPGDCLRGSQSYVANIVASQVSIQKPTRSDSELYNLKNSDTKAKILSAMDEMCHTFGQFHNQFRQLMGKMMIALDRC